MRNFIHKPLSQVSIIELYFLSSEFFTEESKKQAAEIEKELYDLQLQQNNIIRRQSELIYTLEDLWVREQV